MPRTNVINTFNAKRFSVTVIESENKALSVKGNKVSVKFYPIPTNGLLYIKTENALKSIIVYSISGKKIRSFSNIKNSKINIKNLKAGVYLLKIKTSNGIVFKKVIKK